LKCETPLRVSREPYPQKKASRTNGICRSFGKGQRQAITEKHKTQTLYPELNRKYSTTNSASSWRLIIDFHPQSSWERKKSVNTY